MTPQETRFEFEALPTADLVVDAIYAGGSDQTFAADPLGRLLPVGNQGGFRYKVGAADRTVLVVALYTSGREPDWPDSLDEQTGLFTYYGDNRHPGRELHATARGGNRILRDAFERSHADADARASVPPFLLFAGTGSGRDIRFRGLLAPGAATLGADEDLQAIWRSTGGQRFQNYRAQFTVLDEPVVTRAWLGQVLAGDPLGPSCPITWRSWTNGRGYRSLIAPPTTVIRGKATQMPDRLGQVILATIHDWFADDPHGFEACAVELWRMIAPATGTVDLTRPSRDGGRDAVSVATAKSPVMASESPHLAGGRLIVGVLRGLRSGLRTDPISKPRRTTSIEDCEAGVGHHQRLRGDGQPACCGGLVWHNPQDGQAGAGPPGGRAAAGAAGARPGSG